MTHPIDEADRMTDIVTRLRATSGLTEGRIIRERKEAADTIERLREALTKIADEEPDAIGHSWGHTYVREFVGIAKAALQRQKPPEPTP